MVIGSILTSFHTSYKGHETRDTLHLLVAEYVTSVTEWFSGNIDFSIPRIVLLLEHSDITIPKTMSRSQWVLWAIFVLSGLVICLCWTKPKARRGCLHYKLWFKLLRWARVLAPWYFAPCCFIIMTLGLKLTIRWEFRNIHSNQFIRLLIKAYSTTSIPLPDHSISFSSKDSMKTSAHCLNTCLVVARFARRGQGSLKILDSEKSLV